MKFELKPDNRNSSDQDLIDDLISVAKNLNKDSITRNEYNKYGRYSEGTLRKRFGGWLLSLDKAGLYSTKTYSDQHRAKDYYTDEQLIDELVRITSLPDVKILTETIFEKYKKISAKKSVFELRFGSWVKALKIAGVNVASSQSRYSDENLFENLLNVWTYYGRQPYITEMNISPSKINGSTYSNRFGNWRKALESFVKRMNRSESEDKQISKENEIVKNSIKEEIRKQSIKPEDRRSIGLGLRYKVLSRDNFKCVRCGRSPATSHGVELHVDHKLPFSMRGKTTFENLETKCKECNLGKSNRHSE